MTAKKSAPAYDKKVLQEISELLHEKKCSLGKVCPLGR
ncbi:hypothetical protein LEP1GSC083_3031 [Leptospira interrogans serovar Pyrogenes str. L0374]|uniref:Uncharacterized protein n=1 Tax=Leptospira interrogans serovar Pyrogenes str. L0374 TaxID=1049928 RepID=M6KKQ6_LEPIR|nr:hypothetical protein LEP1GSC083_3031 [Leptospira interrogans serovar Pyrogenes str. L0374]